MIGIVSPTDRTTVLHLHSGNLFGGVETMLVTLCGADDAVPLRHEFLLAFDGRLRKELMLQHARADIVGPVRLRRPWTVVRLPTRSAPWYTLKAVAHGVPRRFDERLHGPTAIQYSLHRVQGPLVRKVFFVASYLHLVKVVWIKDGMGRYVKFHQLKR